jgi:hypothetical protein
MKQVPVNFNSPDFQMRTELDGRIYTLRFIYNERAERFTLSIGDESGAEIVSGIAVVSNFPLLNRFLDPRLPPGVLFALDTTDSGLDPTADTFGSEVVLVYATASELAAL